MLGYIPVTRQGYSSGLRFRHGSSVKVFWSGGPIKDTMSTETFPHTQHRASSSHPGVPWWCPATIAQVVSGSGAMLISSIWHTEPQQRRDGISVQVWEGWTSLQWWMLVANLCSEEWHCWELREWQRRKAHKTDMYHFKLADLPFVEPLRLSSQRCWTCMHFYRPSYPASTLLISLSSKYLRLSWTSGRLLSTSFSVLCKSCKDGKEMVGWTGV